MIRVNRDPNLTLSTCTCQIKCGSNDNPAFEKVKKIVGKEKLLGLTNYLMECP